MGARIAALIGDFYHRSEPMRAALEAAAAGFASEFDFYTNPADVPWDSLSRLALIVVAREGRLAPRESEAVWFEPRHQEAIARYVREGGGLAALHSGLASYGHAGPYGRTLHGSFMIHPEGNPEFRLRSTGASHPIVEGFQEMTLSDEMYFVRVDASSTTRLLEVSSPDYGSSTAAWAHPCGEGRVFCFTPGHRDEVLADPAYRQFLSRGLRWAGERQ